MPRAADRPADGGRRQSDRTPQLTDRGRLSDGRWGRCLVACVGIELLADDAGRAEEPAVGGREEIDVEHPAVAEGQSHRCRRALDRHRRRRRRRDRALVERTRCALWGRRLRRSGCRCRRFPVPTRAGPRRARRAAEAAATDIGRRGRERGHLGEVGDAPASRGRTGHHHYRVAWKVRWWTRRVTSDALVLAVVNVSSASGATACVGARSDTACSYVVVPRVKTSSASVASGPCAAASHAIRQERPADRGVIVPGRVNRGRGSAIGCGHDLWRARRGRRGRRTRMRRGLTAAGRQPRSEHHGGGNPGCD